MRQRTESQAFPSLRLLWRQQMVSCFGHEMKAVRKRVLDVERDDLDF